MYANRMGVESQSKHRTTRTEWVDSALNLLTKSGIGSVSIERLAKMLGVTRGSFYHHFPNREALLLAVLEEWAQRWTYTVRDQVADLGLDPATTLLALMNTIRKQKAADYDAPIRAWALHDPLAREVVASVDEARLGYARSQFEALGFSGLVAENRARLFLYYEMASASIFLSTPPEVEAQLLVERHRFLTRAEAE